MDILKKFKDKTIGVFFGGRNAEHDVSIITGEFILAELKKMGLNVKAIYIGKDGRFFINQKIGRLKFFRGDYQRELEKMKLCQLDLSAEGDFLELKEEGILGRKIKIDFAFPAFHGLYGEDGTVQGLFEFLNLPYAGCGVYASAVGINKIITKELMKSLNLQITDYLNFNKGDYQKNKNEVLNVIKEKLTFPVFVKPAKSGSSIGMSKVDKESELESALDLGFFYDNDIVVENGVGHLKDLTCAVLSNGQKIITSEVQQSVFDEGEFFDYDKKYMEEGGAQTGRALNNLVIPADISGEIEGEIKTISKKIFMALRANGMIRVDFLLNSETEELFVNEINTLPGTLYHHLWKKSGKNIDEVLEWMLADGLNRMQQRKNISVEFDSEILKSANSMKLKF